LLCGTRNLTDDVSWDALVRLDGPAGTRPLAFNKPLVDLVTALPSFAVRPLPSERLERIEDLAEELRRVDWELPPSITELAFHVSGLRRARGPAPVTNVMSGRRHLVLSPFLDDAGLAAAIADSQDATVVSRAEAFEALAPDSLQGLTCRVISPMAGLHQPDEHDSTTATASDPTTNLLGGLHAKIYIVEAGRRAHMVIGSPNATRAGLANGNVEFAVELVGGRKNLGVDQFIGPDAALAAILENYNATGGAPEPAEETIGRELERFLRRTAACALSAQVSPDGQRWTEHVCGQDAIEIPANAQLQVGLLTQPGIGVAQVGRRVDACFNALVTADITPFVVLRATKKEGALTVERATVARAELVGDPPSRLDEVIARQVDTPEKFLRFLALLLGLSGDFFAAATQGSGGTTPWLFSRVGEVGLFELLVRAVADRPAAIDDLDRLVRRLETTEQGRRVMPDGFVDLWTTIRRAHERATGPR
jgi:hypothetical protein